MVGLDGGDWGGYDDDDWGLSADQLEQDAYRKLAERKASSIASTAPATSPLPSRALEPATTASSPVRNNHSASRASLDSRFGKLKQQIQAYDPKQQ